MNKLDMLFIRACKARDPQKRLRSVVRQFYLVCANHDRVVMSNLARICDEYSLIDLQDFINYMQPNNVWKCKENDDDDPTIAILVSAIRYASINKFPGLISPQRFKK